MHDEIYGTKAQEDVRNLFERWLSSNVGQFGFEEINNGFYEKQLDELSLSDDEILHELSTIDRSGNGFDGVQSFVEVLNEHLLELEQDTGDVMANYVGMGVGGYDESITSMVWGFRHGNEDEIVKILGDTDDVRDFVTDIGTDEFLELFVDDVWFRPSFEDAIRALLNRRPDIQEQALNNN